MKSGIARTWAVVVAVWSDWLPERVSWKELGSSPNLWFSEDYAVFRLLKVTCMAEMEFVETIKDLGNGYI